MKEKVTLKEWGTLVVGMFIVSAAVYYIMLPSQFVVGSISGLVMILTNFIPLSQSVLTFILNAALLIVGYLFIGKEFGLKTVVTSMMLPVFLGLFEIITPNNQPIFSDMLANLITYVFVISCGQAILFNANASSGGLDIVAKLLNKYLHLELGKGIQIAGFVTAAASILVYDLETLAYSILGTYLCGIVLDYFIDGFHMKKRICILSPNPEAIRSYIVNELQRGVTMYKAYGGINNEEKIEIVTILEKNEYQKLLDYIHKTDEKAFITISSVGEVVGEWHKKKRTK